MERLNSSASDDTSSSDATYLRLVSFLLVLNITNVLLHSVGSLLLLATYKKSKLQIQHMLLINLSIAELWINVFDILRTIPDLIQLNLYTARVFAEVQECLLILSYAGVSVVFYATMFYITGNKFMEIKLNISYRVYINEPKAKKLLLVTWTVCLLASVCISISYFITRFEWLEAFFTYFVPLLNFGYLGLFFVTYGFIFFKYRDSQLKPPSYTRRKSKRGNIEISAFAMFRKSKFYVSFLLIVSFILLMIIPDLLYLFLSKSIHNTKMLQIGCSVIYACSNIVDALIMIFLQQDVKKEWRKKLVKLRVFTRKSFVASRTASGKVTPVIDL